MKKMLILLILSITLGTTANAQNKGYEFSFDLNGGPGVQEHINYTLGLSVINGYRFSPNIFVGVGVGLRYANGALFLKEEQYSPDLELTLSYTEQAFTFHPYLRIKSNLTNTNNSPFIQLDFGYSFLFSSATMTRTYNGIFLEPQIGIDFNQKEKTALFLALGYNLQEYHYAHSIIVENKYNTSSHENLFTGMLNIHFGMRF